MNIPAHYLTRRSALGVIGAGSAAAALAACSTSNSNGGGGSDSSKRDDYSGEVKFEKFDTSAGNYEPATREHPAKNVPKPIKPDNLNEKSVEGFYANIGFIMAAIQYLGGTWNVDPLLETNFDYKDSLAQTIKTYIKEDYTEKNWTDVKFKISLDTPQPTIEGDKYNWNGKIIVDRGNFYVYSRQAHDVPQDQRISEEAAIFTGTYQDGKWKISIETSKSASPGAGSGSSTGSGLGGFGL